MTTVDNLTETLIAVQDLLRKIARLNVSIAKIETLDPDDTLSVDGLKQYKRQLTEDLAALLAHFDLDVQLKSLAA
jgi:hypothetical protein